MSLYTSSSGRAVNHFSNSAIDAYRFCRRKFRLSRIDGWKEKSTKASVNFGKAIEDSIQYFHENGCKPDDAVDNFKRLWLKWKDWKGTKLIKIEDQWVPEGLVFSAQENSWQDLYGMGSEMLKLYEIRHKSLPIRNPRFQPQYSKKLWPGTQYDELEFLAYIDVLSTLEDGTRLIIDIKTAKSKLDVTPNMLAMDGQLRKYAWVSGINEVGFLNFVKARPGLKHGDVVSLLEPVGLFEAGWEAVVAKFSEAKPATEKTPAESSALLLGYESVVQLMDEELEKITGKWSGEKKDEVVKRYLEEGKLFSADKSSVSKTRLQFIRATIPLEEMADVGQSIGNDMMQIKESVKNNFFPLDGGVKFPDQKCTWCSFNSICLKDSKRRDENLVQINANKPEDDWLLELEGETE